MATKHLWFDVED